MADHGIITLARPAPVDIPVPSTHRTKLRSEVGSQRIKNRIPKSHPSGLIPDQRSKDVAFPKVQSDRDAQGFLAPSEKHATFNHSSPIEAGQLLLQHAGEEHHAVGFDKLGSGNSRGRLGI